MRQRLLIFWAVLAATCVTSLAWAESPSNTGQTSSSVPTTSASEYWPSVLVAAKDDSQPFRQADSCRKVGKWKEAAELYRKAAEQGSAKAQAAVGYLYSHGKGVQQDSSEAAKWYRKAADQGNAIGYLALGQFYSDGKGVPHDPSEAQKWYSKAAAAYQAPAKQGNAYAQGVLGDLYCEGKGVRQDYTEAAKWCRRAAEQGDAYGQRMLGWLYSGGKGVKQDYSEAVKWCRKAAQQGDAYSQKMLGSLYSDGKGVKQDYSEAMKWYREAAQQGDAHSQMMIGLFYSDGKGVKQDYSEALKWYRMASKQGDANAQTYLAIDYYEGRGVPKDYAEAAKLFRKAAEQGDAFSQKILGGLYSSGIGVHRDYSEAMKWYCKAGEQSPYLFMVLTALILLIRLLIVALLVTIAWYFRCKRQSTPFAVGLGFSQPSSKEIFGSVVLAALCSIPACLGAIIRVSSPGRPIVFGSNLDFILHGVWGVPLVLIIIPFAAFAEEAFFRGFLLPVMAKKWGPFVALMTVTLLFGFMHFGRHGLSLLLVMVLGLVFGLQRMVTRSTTLCFITHAIYNEILLLLIVLTRSA